MSGGARLVLVRHGETVGNSSLRYYGRTDLCLSEEGRAQMRAAASVLAGRYGVTALTWVFASPLDRALEGARLIAGEGRSIITVEEFAEVDFGLFEGLTAEEIHLRFPDEFRRWNKDRLARDYTYPGGESRGAFTMRVERGLERMLASWGTAPDADPGCALIVAHRGVIRTIISRLSGIEPSVALGSVHILGRDGNGRNGRWHPLALDITDHLTGL
jgi:broad specificity phosphatase PhoE